MLLLAILAAALALAVLDWALARATERSGRGGAPAGHLLDWTAGLGSLPTSPLGGGEPLLVATGYGVVAAAATLAGALAGRTVTGVPLPGGLGLFAFSPLLFAFGYALAAQGAGTPEAARRRLLTGGRILLATPAWAVTLAGWAALAGVTGPWGAGGEATPLWLRALLASAILGSGLFILPGSAGELGFASRTWGGDAHEASRAVRAFTALAHYATFAAVLGLSGTALAGAPPRGAVPGLAAGGLLSLLVFSLPVLAGLATRRLTVWAPAARVVRGSAALLPGFLLILVLVLSLLRRGLS